MRFFRVAAGVVSVSVLLLALVATEASASDAVQDPMGAIDAVWSTGSVVNGAPVLEVSGWVADPDDVAGSPQESAVMVMYLDGQQRDVSIRNQVRPDVTNAYPFVQQPAGWRMQAVVPEDGAPHELCFVARNVGPGTDLAIGCRTLDPGARDGHEPTGVVDLADARAGMVHFIGWVGDVDTSATRGRVRLTLNGYDLAEWSADYVRADVSAARPDLATAAGFEGTLAVPPGRYSWCLTAVNVGPIGLGNTKIGCGEIDVPASTGRALGSVDSLRIGLVSSTDAAIFASGWAWDPAARRVPEVVVHVLIGGTRLPAEVDRAATVGYARPDVAQSVIGASDDTGWRSSFGITRGVSPVYACAFAIIDGLEEFINCRGVDH